MNEEVDCVVIGAGVIGLAIARAISMSHREVIILEQENSFGTGISSRNSEVIHAGLYNPPRAFKSSFCVRGRQMLYRYLDERGIAHRRCGKLVVASNQQQSEILEGIATNALECGVTDLQMLTGDAARALEPELNVIRALFSPSSGIVDSSALMLALLGDAQQHGAALALQGKVIGGGKSATGVTLVVSGDGEFELNARSVVNAAGLGAQQVAMQLAVPSAMIPTQRLAKGHYFSLSASCPFRHLIYPVPEPGGLGIHLTLDLGGQAKFGPDVQWVDEVEFSVDTSRRDTFVERIHRYWPGLDGATLTPAYAGIRPKLADHDDFVISGRADHGMSGLINLFGIESPGLTAALAIAEYVVGMLDLGA